LAFEFGQKMLILQYKQNAQKIMLKFLQMPIGPTRTSLPCQCSKQARAATKQEKIYPPRFAEKSFSANLGVFGASRRKICLLFCKDLKSRLTGHLKSFNFRKSAHKSDRSVTFHLEAR
jgi:hypothetical protein